MSGRRIFVLIVLLIFILFFPFRIVQLITLLYLAVLGLSYFYAYVISRYVVVLRREQTLRTHRLEEVEAVLFVENRSFLPVHYLTITDRPNHFFLTGPGRFLVSLAPRERKKLSYPLASQDRGEFTLGPLVVQGSDPLGLFPWVTRLTRHEDQLRLIVYPEVHPLDLEHHKGLPAGNIRVESRIFEDVTQYRSIREYIPGDDMMRISWKASARTGKLCSMDYLPYLHVPVMIILNLAREDYPLRYRYHYLERAATMAASLVTYFVGLKQEVGLVTCASIKGQSGFPAAEIRGTHGHALHLLEILARVQASAEHMNFNSLIQASGIRIPPQARIEVITPLLTEEQRAFLRRLKERGCAVEVFLVGTSTWRAEELRVRAMISREFTVFSVKDYGSELVYK